MCSRSHILFKLTLIQQNAEQTFDLNISTPQRIFNVYFCTNILEQNWSALCTGLRYIHHHHPWISVVKSVNEVYCFLKHVRPMFHDEYKTQGWMELHLPSFFSCYIWNLAMHYLSPRILASIKRWKIGNGFLRFL